LMAIDQPAVTKTNPYAFPAKDPFDGPEYRVERTSGNLLVTLFSWTGYAGTFSEKREEEIWKWGFWNGWYTSFFGEFEECPDFWKGTDHTTLEEVEKDNESQYCEGGQASGYFARLFIYMILFMSGGLALIQQFGGFTLLHQIMGMI
jgi:hypothetical protein